MKVLSEVVELARKAKEASHNLASLSTEIKDKALLAMAGALVREGNFILKENEKDLQAARGKGISTAMMDRLLLNEDRLQGMAQGLKDVVALRDPVGEIVKGWRRPNGLVVTQVRTPIGVIGMVYEARPNVTADAAGLCVKSGNAVVMRGGSEALHSNIAIAQVLSEAAGKAGVPEGAINLVKTPERQEVIEMLKLRDYIDLLIPRGGEGLIQLVVENATIPVIKHFKGICHIYVDEAADLKMAARVANNAKTQRPSVCNALETLLVHVKVAPTFLPLLTESFAKPVEIRGCSRTCQILPEAKEASEKDWATEYLDLILSVKVVDNLEEAVAHIQHYTSGLSEAIITENYSHATTFLQEVDSAAVYVNASTRFTDGGEFGLGTEVGITTDKVFPRGPMGLEALTSTKYVVYGNGQVRT